MFKYSSADCHSNLVRKALKVIIILNGCWKIHRTPLENRTPPMNYGKKHGKNGFDVPGKMKPLIHEMYEIPPCFMITLQ